MIDEKDYYPSPFGSQPKESKRAKAVAIEYDREKAPAPRITAAGEGHIAEQILAIAFANDIKVREDADLVEILSVMDVETPIPLEAYAAVGEILSYVYQANSKATKQKSVQADDSAVDLPPGF